MECVIIIFLTVLPSLFSLSLMSLGCLGSRALLATSSVTPTAVTPNKAVTRCQSFIFCRSVEMTPCIQWNIESCNKAMPLTEDDCRYVQKQLDLIPTLAHMHFSCYHAVNKPHLYSPSCWVQGCERCGTPSTS